MQFVEYDDAYVIERENFRELTDNNRLDVDLGDGLYATFIRKKKPKKGQEPYKLSVLDFDKEFWSEEDVGFFWSDYEVRCLTRKVSWNKSVPLAEDIAEFGGDKFILIIPRNTGYKELLHVQIKDLKNGLDPIEEYGKRNNVDVLSERFENSFSIVEKNNADLKTHQIPLTGDTILKQFKNYMKENNRINDIIDFLSVQNGRFLSESLTAKQQNKKIDPEYLDEVIEFADYFWNEIQNDAVWHAEMENWGQEALILVVAENETRKRQIEEEREGYDDMTDVAKREAETLRDTILEISGDKLITSQSNGFAQQYIIPKDIPEADELYVKEFTLYVCARTVRERGSIVIRQMLDNGQHNIAGIFVNQLGMWSPITKEEMRASMLTLPNGTILEPEDNEDFVDLQRRKF